MTRSGSDEQVEQEIDQRLPYRTGWPTLPVLPLWFCLDRNLESYFPDRERHLSQIRAILEAQRVKSTNIIICHRLHYGASKTDASTATLFIGTEPDSTNPYMALREIRKYLQSQNVHVAIEIMDERAQKRKTFVVLPSDTAIIDAWNGGLRDKTIDMLNQSGLEWTSLNVFYRGLEDNRYKCLPTILVSASDASDKHWWETVLPDIRSVCPDDFDVELVYHDQLVFTLQEEAASAARRLTRESFMSEISIGASIGPAGTSASGTLGGMVELRRGNQDMGTFGLSNHHFVLSDPLRNETKGPRCVLPKHNIVANKNLFVKAPSDQDTMVRLEILTDELALLRSNLDGSQGQLGVHAQVDMGEELKRPALNRLTNVISRIESEKTDIESFNRDVGFVFASSGYRTSGSAVTKKPWALDWSLVKIEDPPRSIQNTLPDHGGSPPVGLARSIQVNKCSTTVIPGHRVAKLGRSSGWTEGKINGIETLFSKKGSSYDDGVVAWAVVPEYFPAFFALPGDSGSIVFDVEPGSPTRGAWYGLVLAANMYNGVGYFTPIDVVLNDVRHVTGCDVVEPQSI